MNVERMDFESMEALLDSARPRKESLPTGIARATYLGMIAAIETLGIEWCQLESGQHVLLGVAAAANSPANHTGPKF